MYYAVVAYADSSRFVSDWNSQVQSVIHNTQQSVLELVPSFFVLLASIKHLALGMRDCNHTTLLQFFKKSMSFCSRDGIPLFPFGPIYVRENGKLHLLINTQENNRPAALKPSTLRLFSKEFSVELCLKQEDDTTTQRTDHFIFTYTKEGSLRYTAKSLFNMVLGFISDNVHYVDSLLDFPEQIAEKLFLAAEAKQKFAKPVTGAVALLKFTEAYGSRVLCSLCLRNRHLVVSAKLEEIKSFQGLTCLDLSYCKLGDGHELLEHLTAKTLSSLIQLYVKDNCLSDVGIRKMTAPIRVMKRGLKNLAVFDLSCNPNITDRVVAFLLCFQKLDCLDISNTGVTDRKAVIQKVRDSLGLVCAEEPLKEFDHTNCKTRGWAEQVVLQWDQEVAEAVKPKDSLILRTAAQNFYGKTKQIHSAEPLPCAFINIYTCGKLQFLRKVTELANSSLSTKDPVVVEDAEMENTKKRSVDVQSTSGDHSSISAKRKHANLTPEDWDLINKY